MTAICFAVVLCSCAGNLPRDRRAAGSLDAPRRGEIALWIEWAGNEQELQSKETRTALFRELRTNGFTRVCFETVSTSGERRFAGADGARLFAGLIADARAAGLSTALLYSPFRAPADAPREWLQQGAWGEDGAVVEAAPGAGSLSPVNPAVRTRVLDELKQLARLNPGMIVLVDFAFRGPRADVSPAARAAFERHQRRAVQRWPGDALPAEGGDPEREARWIEWRAHELRELLFDMRADFAAMKGAPALAAIVDGSWHSHIQGGLNWASQQPLAAGFVAGLPAQYEQAATAHLLDVVVLGVWSGVLTEPEARDAGWNPAVSASAISSDARVLLAGQTPQWETLMLDGRAVDADWRERAQSLLKTNDGVLVISLGGLRKVGLK